MVRRNWSVSRVCVALESFANYFLFFANLFLFFDRELRWIIIISVIRTYHVGNTVKASTESRKSKIDFGGSYQGIDKIRGAKVSNMSNFACRNFKDFWSAAM